MKVPICWSNREVPLIAEAVYVPQTRVVSLIKNLLTWDDVQLEELSGLISAKGIVLLGQENRLPWVNDCQYLGRQQDAPHFYMNTVLQPNIPPGLLDPILFDRWSEPFALLRDSLDVIPLAAARQLHRSALSALL